MARNSVLTAAATHHVSFESGSPAGSSCVHSTPQSYHALTSTILQQTAAAVAGTKKEAFIHSSSNVPCIPPVRQSCRQQLAKQAWHVLHAVVCCSCALVAITNHKHAVNVSIAGLHAANVYHVLQAWGQQQRQWDPESSSATTAAADWNLRRVRLICLIPLTDTIGQRQ
jgi:hypothetical protein